MPRITCINILRYLFYHSRIITLMAQMACTELSCKMYKRKTVSTFDMSQIFGMHKLCTVCWPGGRTVQIKHTCARNPSDNWTRQLWKVVARICIGQIRDAACRQDGSRGWAAGYQCSVTAAWQNSSWHTKILLMAGHFTVLPHTHTQIQWQQRRFTECWISWSTKLCKNCQYDKTLHVLRIVNGNVLKQVIDMKNAREHIFEFWFHIYTHIHQHTDIYTRKYCAEYCEFTIILAMIKCNLLSCYLM